MSDRKRILIVDDTPANIKILNELLKTKYNISVATNGSDALGIASSGSRPDIILLDIMMPGMDGYEVCRRLKADEKTLDIPVIFVTTKNEVGDEKKGFEVGCVDYITKPFSPPIVLARVETHLALHNAMKKLEEQNVELIKAAELREDVERISRHDLKNPLTSIFTGVHLLEADPSISEDQREIIEMISDGAYGMLNMINLSLDLFKMERGIYRPDLKEVDMIDNFLRAKRDLQSLISVKKVGLAIAIEGKSASGLDKFLVLGENLLIYSMIANLLKNAAEASPNGENINVNLYYGDESAIIEIQNKGVVPFEIYDKFFEKYVTYGKKSGTGLGTYSARLMARTLNGDITMSSSEDQGTKLVVTLPKIL